jgi:protein-S-isoprenylcysteine O-methyltransferase Ste14
MKQQSELGWSKNWWKGKYGEYWVVAQIILLSIFIALPTQPLFDFNEYEILENLMGWVLATIFMFSAALIILRGIFDLGKSLTILPYPKHNGKFVKTGIYAIIRHPLYFGIILATQAWTIFTLSWTHLICSITLAILLNIKASNEEKWLLQKYSDYAEYKTRVKKIIPGIY